MIKSFTIKKIIIDLLSDRKIHCIKEVVLHVNNFCELQSIEISKSSISQSISYLHRHDVIEKYGRFIKLK